eukprot:1354955-Amphidinium_carterae.1
MDFCYFFLESSSSFQEAEEGILQHCIYYDTCKPRSICYRVKYPDYATRMMYYNSNQTSILVK